MHKTLVLDANILIRAVLGQRVRSLIERHARSVSFFAPELAYTDARQYLPELLRARGVDPELALAVLANLETIVLPLTEEQYSSYRQQAEYRIAIRDPEDWPVVACALALDCPIWTEDADFFGSGIATWTTDRVEIFMREAEW